MIAFSVHAASRNIKKRACGALSLRYLFHLHLLTPISTHLCIRFGLVRSAVSVFSEYTAWNTDRPDSMGFHDIKSTKLYISLVTFASCASEWRNSERSPLYCETRGARAQDVAKPLGASARNPIPTGATGTRDFTTEDGIIIAQSH